MCYVGVVFVHVSLQATESSSLGEKVDISELLESAGSSYLNQVYSMCAVLHVNICRESMYVCVRT